MSNDPKNPVNPFATKQTEPQRTQPWPEHYPAQPSGSQPQYPEQPYYPYPPQHYQQPHGQPTPDQYQQHYPHQQYYQYPPQYPEQQSYETNPLNQPSALDLKMEPHLAAALSYILFIVSGIAFLALERKSHFVRFHAMQSILFTATWFICTIGSAVVMMILGMAAAIAGFTGPLKLLGFAMNLISIGFFVVWILLMVKAYQGDKWKLPVIGDLAEKHVNKF